MDLTDWDVAIVVTALERLQRMEQDCALDKRMSQQALEKFKAEFDGRMRVNRAQLRSLKAAKKKREVAA